MWYSAIIFFLIIGFISAQCPPSDAEMKRIVKFLEAKLESIKKTKPGTNTKDADYLINRLIHDVVTSKKFAPCNQGFVWDDMLPDINKVRAECYHPGDFTTAPVQKEFVNCAKKFFPEFFLKYGDKGINVCVCFGNTILPNWDKYKKIANFYVEEYKTLKHRKK